MKIRKSPPRVPALLFLFIVVLWFILLAHSPHAIFPHRPRDFVTTAPYAAPVSPPPSFTVPQIITAHCKQDCAIISLFTAGIDMSFSKRNLSAVACRIGNHVVRALSFERDVLHCPADLLKPGDLLAPVLLRDSNLQRALEGPVTLATGVVAELHENDLLPVGDLSVHSGLKHSDLAVVPSQYIYHPSPPARKWRWQVCLMTQIKPATYLLPNWVDYHRRIGVDRVFIFDNGASEDIGAMFAGRTDVEVMRWPYHKSQLQLVGFFLFAARDICEHVLHMDADEFFMFGLGSPEEFAEEPPLPRYIRRVMAKGMHSFRLPYITMRNSGYRLRPRGPVPELFVHKSEEQVFFNGKSVCSTDLDYDSGRVHSCGIIAGREAPFYAEKPSKWGDINMYPTKLDDPGFVVHYRERSWEEWVERMNAGWVVGKLVKDAFKNVLDIEKPAADFMAVNESLRYTHFRDVYRRVVNEGRLDRAYTVRKDLLERKRCTREINVGRQYLPSTAERCRNT